jgi:hypothetical protein
LFSSLSQFYCMISQQIFFYISVLVLLLSTIAAVLFVASPGIRTSSFLLYVLFANGPLVARASMDVGGVRRRIQPVC